MRVLDPPHTSPPHPIRHRSAAPLPPWEMSPLSSEDGTRADDTVIHRTLHPVNTG